MRDKQPYQKKCAEPDDDAEYRKSICAMLRRDEVKRRTPQKCALCVCEIAEAAAIQCKDNGTVCKDCCDYCRNEGMGRVGCGAVVVEERP